MKYFTLGRNFQTVISLFSFAHFLTTASFASDCSKGGFLPKNEMQVGVFSVLANGMTEARFNEILSKVEAYYSPVIAQRGARFVVNRLWTSNEVNAYAHREGSSWVIDMHGGLARHSAVTDDAFALVACHETGHHLGGAPKYRGDVMSNEGQADYFATLKCLRNIWASDNNSEIIKSMQTDPNAVSGCEKSFSDKASIDLCIRASMAGLSSANLSRSLDGSAQPNFNTPDPSVVSSTYDPHPKAQCRLDTYFSGSICQVATSEAVSDTDPTQGTCSVEKNFTVGARPLCWYKPGDGGGTNPPPSGDIARSPTIGGSTNVTVSNPNMTIALDYDVSGFAGAFGAYLEIIGPNRDFSQPNGLYPDSQRILWLAQPNTRGQFAVVPVRDMPMGWGVYAVRVIPLDQSGSRPMGRFSNSSYIRMQPTR